MALSLRSLRSALIVAGLLALPVAMLVASLKAPQQLSPLDRAVRRIGAPLEAAVAYSAGTMAGFLERWLLQARLQDANEELLRDNRQLRQRLRTLEHLEQENAQLRRALQLRDKVPEDLLSAERIGVDQSPFFRVMSIRLDRGDRFVTPGMAVLAPDGVVGRIDKTFDDYCDVMLLTDPRSKVAVEIPRVRAQGILEGGHEDLAIVEVSKDFEIQVGDLVQTSGVDQLFPGGHPVGQVIAVEPLVGDRQRLNVLPAVRFDRVDVAWVVLANAPAPDERVDERKDPGVAIGLHPLH
jgi:rod shape-determining protein MreC